MNGYERVMAAIHRQEADRVPVISLAVMRNVMESLFYPGITEEDFVAGMDLDAIVISGQDGYLAEWLDADHFRDEWGVVWRVSAVQKVSYSRVGTPVDGPLKSERDLEHYTPPDMADERRWRRLQSAVSRFKGEKAIIFLDFEAFRIGYCLRGLAELLTDFVLRPTFATCLLDMVAARRSESIRIACELGADILITADDYAFKTGSLMSLCHFDRFILPYIEQKARLARQLGVPYIKHSDGNLWSTLDRLVAAGVDAINPLEPMAGMDIWKVKQRYGHALALIGNLDVSLLLPYGTPADVDEAVKETIAKAGPGGGYILCDSNSVHEAVSPANYRAMVLACRRWGRYPLDPDMVEEYRTHNYMERY